MDTNDQSEREELAEIYVSRGLDPALARQVVDQLMAHDALGAHARDELGIYEIKRARPVLAAFVSAGTFAIGAALPLLVVFLAPANTLAAFVVGTSLAFLAILGSLAARAGGARPTVGALRVTVVRVIDGTSTAPHSKNTATVTGIWPQQSAPQLLVTVTVLPD